MQQFLYRVRHASARDCGFSALVALAIAQWLLIALATSGHFALWPLVLPVLLFAIGAALLTLRRLTWLDRGVVVFLVLLGALLYLPPAEELALTGDAAIYVNEGIFVAKTGGLTAVHAPLAALPPATRTLFYITSAEQAPNDPITAYAGMVYRGYYMANPDHALIRTSRMPLTTVWFAFAYALGGVQVALYSTPLFAVLALLLLYATGRQLVAWPVALLITSLLAVSYIQVYLGRISYAEIFGQFWTVAGILAALCWLERRTPSLLVIALFCWATTWAGRIDALLLLPSIGLLFIYAGVNRDRATLVTVAWWLPVLLLLLPLGTNGAYVGATYQILTRPWPWFGAAVLALGAALPVGTALAWRWGQPLQRHLQRWAPLLHWLALALTAFVILWATLPNPLRDAAVTRPFQEIIWFSSAYLTPLFYWLVLLGVGRLLIGGYDAKRLWLLLTFYSLAIVFFYTYTSARVYPVSMRRLASDLLPLMVLLIGIALTPLRAPRVDDPRLWAMLAPHWQWGRWGVALVAIGWMALLCRPLWPVHEGSNTLAFLSELHRTLPEESVVIFEPQDSDSWVGWLAAPLYSLYDDWALQLDSDTPDPALWQTAVDALIASGRAVYVATQQPTYPPPLQVNGYTAVLAQEMPWQSTLIGQTRDPYPPPVWNFVHPVHLYRLTPLAAASPVAPLTITAPDGKLRVELTVAATPATQLHYSVTYADRRVLHPSTIEFNGADGQPLTALTIVDQQRHSVDEAFATPFGQNGSARNYYNELLLTLREVAAPYRTAQLTMRLYNQGLALRQAIPRQTDQPLWQMGYNRVDFALDAADLAYGQIGTEGAYVPSAVEQLPITATTASETPLTLVLNNGLLASIMEAQVVDYPRSLLARRADATATLTTVPAAALRDTDRLPSQAPWRVVLVADNAPALAMSSGLLDLLNPPSVLTDTTWIRPGVAMRVMRLTTAGAREVIAFAAAHGFDYVALDAGWYGLGYKEEANPASDATQVIAAIDLPQVLAAARAQGVGVWLYVNWVALERQLDQLLPLYASWGIAGIKLGFVDGRSQMGINFVHEVVRKAAAYHLMVDIHDNYRPSGVSRTWPNLLTQEGVRGNEHFPGAAQQTLLPFTRLLAGAADTTFTYYTDRLNVTRAHQLAAQIVFFSPLRFVLWYDFPVDYRGEPEVDLMGALPTVWDETRVLAGALGDYIVVARRRGETWFVGALSDEEARTLPIDLTFLAPDRQYRAQIYADGTPTQVTITEQIVTAATTFAADLLPSGGQLLWLTPQ